MHQLAEFLGLDETDNSIQISASRDKIFEDRLVRFVLGRREQGHFIS